MCKQVPDIKRSNGGNTVTLNTPLQTEFGVNENDEREPDE